MHKLIFTFLIFNSLFLNAQNDEKEIKLKIACGFTGVTSTELINIQGLIKARQFILLRQLLVSELKLSNVLSVIAVKELYKANSISLTKEELNRIKVISSWKYNLSICKTCSIQVNGLVSEILEKQNIVAYQIIKKEIFKEN